MTILYHFDTGPLWRAQIWAFGRLVSLDCGDLRYAMLELVSRGIAAMGNTLFRHIAGRAWQGARFAGRLPLLPPRWQQGADSVRRHFAGRKQS